MVCASLICTVCEITITTATATTPTTEPVVMSSSQTTTIFFSNVDFLFGLGARDLWVVLVCSVVPAHVVLPLQTIRHNSCNTEGPAVPDAAAKGDRRGTRLFYRGNYAIRPRGCRVATIVKAATSSGGHGEFSLGFARLRYVRCRSIPAGGLDRTLRGKAAITRAIDGPLTHSTAAAGQAPTPGPHLIPWVGPHLLTDEYRWPNRR